MSDLDTWLMDDETSSIPANKKEAEQLAKNSQEKRAEKYEQDKKALLQKLIIPDKYASFFSPFEMEDLQDRFLDFDVDLSGSVSVAELSKVFTALGEEVNVQMLKDLVEQFDENNTGVLEWEEFVAMFAAFKEDNSRAAKFMSILGLLVKTPCVALRQEAKRRKLLVFYQLVETRKADSWNPEQFIMEVGVSGKFYEVVGNTTKMVVESRYFDGIGSTTRAARFRAATMALLNLRENAPGAQYAPGIIPAEWLDWAMSNISAGIPTTQVLKKLKLKGFFPAKNQELMDHVAAFNLLINLTTGIKREPEHVSQNEKRAEVATGSKDGILTSTSSSAIMRQPNGDQKNAQGGIGTALTRISTPQTNSTTSGIKPGNRLVPALTLKGDGTSLIKYMEAQQNAKEPSRSILCFQENARFLNIEDLPEAYVEWLKCCRSRYIDGRVLLNILKREPFYFPIHLNEYVAELIEKAVWMEGDSLPLGGRKYDIFEACRRDDAVHVEDFINAGEDLSAKKRIAGKDWFVSHFAAFNEAVNSIKCLVHADSQVVSQRDEINKGIMHHAAASGSVSVVKYLTKKLEVNMTQIDNYGNLCTHYAADAGHSDCLKWLIAYQVKQVQLIYSAWAFEEDVGTVFREFITNRKSQHVPQTFERPWLLDCIRIYIKSLPEIKQNYVPTPQQAIVDWVVAEKDSDPQSEHVSVSTFIDITRYTILYSFVNRRNNLGRTCIHTAFNPSTLLITDGHEESLHVLLNLAGAFAHIKDKKGLTAEALVLQRGVVIGGGDPKFKHARVMDSQCLLSQAPRLDNADPWFNKRASCFLVRRDGFGWCEMFDTQTKELCYTPLSKTPDIMLDFMPRQMLIREAAQEGQPYWDYLQKYAQTLDQIGDWEMLRVGDMKDDPIKRRIAYTFYRNVKTNFCQWEVPMAVQLHAQTPEGSNVNIELPEEVKAKDHLQTFVANYKLQLKNGAIGNHCVGNWQQCVSCEDNAVYYYNKKTDVSLWQPPLTFTPVHVARAMQRLGPRICSMLQMVSGSYLRREEKYILCEWGCGAWMHQGSGQRTHVNDLCLKRIMPCRNKGCPMVMSAEEWTSVRHAHEKVCVKRKVECPLLCGKSIVWDQLDYHKEFQCPKRQAKPIFCQLGCGRVFKGGWSRALQMERERRIHEEESCLFREVTCAWPGCNQKIRVDDRADHWRTHVQSRGVTVFTEPGDNHIFKVPKKCHELKVQLWGGGGASGHLRERQAGKGGGGSFVEAIVQVNPGETLYITVGSGGQAGGYGLVTTISENEQSIRVGISPGGYPGGGDGHSSNAFVSCGGGGGYSCLKRQGPFQEHVLVLAGGGGGGGSHDGAAFNDDNNIKLDFRRGRRGDTVQGLGGTGGQGDEDDRYGESGEEWRGGNGSSGFGAGGGGGFFGGGGGGYTNGTYGGAGAGSSFVEDIAMNVVMVGGEGIQPGSLGVKGREPPLAALGEEFNVKEGFFAGQGGEADVQTVHTGCSGAVRIIQKKYSRWFM